MISFDSEMHLEDAICSAFTEGFDPISDQHVDKYIRQPGLAPYGTGDILTISNGPDGETELVTLYELKNEKLNISHIAQIARYRKFFEENDENFHSIEYQFNLVCKYTEHYNTDLIMLASSIDWLDIYVFTINLNTGIDFSLLSGYHISDEKGKGKKSLAPLGIYEDKKEKSNDIPKIGGGF